MITVIAAKLGLFIAGTLAFILSDLLYEVGEYRNEWFLWGLRMVARGFLMFFWAFCMAKMLGIL